MTPQEELAALLREVLGEDVLPAGYANELASLLIARGVTLSAGPSEAAVAAAVKAILEQEDVIDLIRYPAVERDVRIALRAAYAIDAGRGVPPQEEVERV